MSTGLRDAIIYIYNPDKTEEHKYIGAYNMILPAKDMEASIYEQMLATKDYFNKGYGRQGYHFKLSFPTGDEVTPEIIMKITEEFCERCLKDYECAFAVHTNAKHLHSHIVFNSLDLVEGLKYQYHPGDWKNYLQPVANEICQKYNLSGLELEMNEKFKLKHRCKKYNAWAKEQGEEEEKTRDTARGYTNDMILRDVDECIAEADTYEEFIELLEHRGHVVDDSGKYIKVLAPGRQRNCRLINLTPDKATYTRENIVKMIRGEYKSFNREDVINMLLSDMNRYYVCRQKLVTSIFSKHTLKEMEQIKLINDKGLFTREKLLDYKDYLNMADKELNILRKRINKGLDARLEAINDMKEILKLYKGFVLYKSGDTSYKNEYDKILSLYGSLADKGYQLVDLYMYNKKGNDMLRLINDYKKHIFVEKKICERIEKQIPQNRQVKKEDQNKRK
jgi:hypothetical protein